jgi:hypothetical protein
VCIVFLYGKLLCAEYFLCRELVGSGKEVRGGWKVSSFFHLSTHCRVSLSHDDDDDTVDDDDDRTDDDCTDDDGSNLGGDGGGNVVFRQKQ